MVHHDQRARLDDISFLVLHRERQPDTVRPERFILIVQVLRYDSARALLRWLLRFRFLRHAAGVMRFFTTRNEVGSIIGGFRSKL